MSLPRIAMNTPKAKSNVHFDHTGPQHVSLDMLELAIYRSAMQLLLAETPPQIDDAVVAAGEVFPASRLPANDLYPVPGGRRGVASLRPKTGTGYSGF